MYSGTTLTHHSGNVLGTHQKIDRVARKHLAELLKDKNKFPAIKAILFFEGKNGPDGIKRKSPARDEPWHYYSPFDDDDSELIDLIKEHYNSLVNELKANNTERIAFEASWLSHALVDGLTPAHHYPYEEELMDLRGGEGIESRNSIRDKIIIPGITRRAKVRNNWKMWGPKGLMSTHGLFEWGVALLLAPLSLDNALPSKKDLDELNEKGMVEIFKNTAREIAILDIYEQYIKRGWTPRVAYAVRSKLGPAVARTVTLAWYSALIDAGIVKTK
jgi:hypothetical protein